MKKLGWFIFILGILLIIFSFVVDKLDLFTPKPTNETVEKENNKNEDENENENEKIDYKGRYKKGKCTIVIGENNNGVVKAEINNKENLYNIDFSYDDKLLIESDGITLEIEKTSDTITVNKFKTTEEQTECIGEYEKE